MKKFAGTILAAAAMAFPLAIAPAIAPIAIPAANADVCGDVGGRHVDVGGCTNVVGDVAVGTALAADDDAAAQVSAGLPPCYTVTGVPYYTPAGEPC